MDRLIYTALSGMQASMQRQRVLASNMANADTIGFRGELMDQRPVTVDGEEMEVRAMQLALVRGADMSPGTVLPTGRNLDIAVDGEALIAVQSPQGGEAYTRRGDLDISAGGLLANGDGHPIMGDAGPITIPPGGMVSIRPDGTVLVADPESKEAPPSEVGRIKLASPGGSEIAKGLDGLFRVRGGGILPHDLEATVKPAHIEKSNVKTTDVLVEMIDQQRLFEMRTKLVSTAREVDESGAQLMRLG